MAVPQGSSSILRLGRLSLPLLSHSSISTRRPISVLTSFRSMPVVERDDVKRVLSVTWDKDTRSVHPFTWLKDYCHCSACAHPSSLNRRKTLQTLDLTCIPQDIAFNDEKSEMTIAWNDGHKSFYPYKWLADRCFVKPKTQESFPVKTWGKGFEPQRLKWSDVVNDDRFLYRFLLALKIEGICKVIAAPIKDGLKRLITKLGVAENNHFGPYIDLISKNEPCNIGFSPMAISPHTDLPYYELPPGSEFLHCITRTPDVIGGANPIADGLHIVEVMQREDPEAYQLLCDIPVHYWNYGTGYLKDYHIEYAQKVIQRDPRGYIHRFVFSTPNRDSKPPHIPLEKVELFYRALKGFEALLYRECIVHHPVQGDIVVVDNHRLIHGRTAYQTKNEGVRRVLTAYVAWDHLNSRLRRLHTKFA